MLAPVLTARLDGGGVSKATVMPAAEMVITAEAVAVGSKVDVAVRVTVFPEGTALGAVKFTNAPPSVWAGFTAPQELPLAQVRVQSMPSFDVSLLTTAVMAAL